MGVGDGVFSEASRVATKDLLTAWGEDGLASNGPARNAVSFARRDVGSAFDEIRRIPTGAGRRQAGEEVPYVGVAQAERKA